MVMLVLVMLVVACSSFNLRFKMLTKFCCVDHGFCLLTRSIIEPNRKMNSTYFILLDSYCVVD